MLFRSRLYGLQDANWNVTCLVNPSGVVQERFAYHAYGLPEFMNASFTLQSSSVSNWDILYAGYRWNSGVDLYHVRNRVYHSVIGVWIQRDMHKLTQRDNKYLYSYSSPNIYLDPSGKIPPIVVGGIGGCAAGAIGGTIGSAIVPVSEFFQGKCIDWDDVLCNTGCGAASGCIGGGVAGAIATTPWVSYAGCLGGAAAAASSSLCSYYFECSPANGCDVLLGFGATLMGCFQGPGAADGVYGENIGELIINLIQEIIETFISVMGAEVVVINFNIGAGGTICDGLVDVFS